MQIRVYLCRWFEHDLYFCITVFFLSEKSLVLHMWKHFFGKFNITIEI